MTELFYIWQLVDYTSVLLIYFLFFQCRHNDVEKIETILHTNDTKQDLYSLKIRYFMGKIKVLVAKISQKVWYKLVVFVTSWILCMVIGICVSVC